VNRQQLVNQDQLGQRANRDRQENQDPQVIAGLRESQDLLVQMVSRDPQDRRDPLVR
jgi:hypothetical protein